MFLAFQFVFSLGGIGGPEKDRNFVSSCTNCVLSSGGGLDFLGLLCRWFLSFDSFGLDPSGRLLLHFFLGWIPIFFPS